MKQFGNLISNINYKRGMFRLWCVLVVPWIIYSIWEYGGNGEVAYTFNYLFNKSSLEQRALKEHQAIITKEIDSLREAQEWVNKCSGYYFDKSVDELIYDPSYTMIIRNKRIRLYGHQLAFDVDNYCEDVIDSKKSAKFIKDLFKIDENIRNRKVALTDAIGIAMSNSNNSINNFKIEEPDWKWFKVAILFPIACLLMIYPLYYLAFAIVYILKWIFGGFIGS